MWKTGLPVRSAVLKPHAGWLVVGWVTTSESRLLYVFYPFCWDGVVQSRNKNSYELLRMTRNHWKGRTGNGKPSGYWARTYTKSGDGSGILRILMRFIGHFAWWLSGRRRWLIYIFSPHSVLALLSFLASLLDLASTLPLQRLLHYTFWSLWHACGRNIFPQRLDYAPEMPRSRPVLPKPLPVVCIFQSYRLSSALAPNACWRNDWGIP